MASHAALNPPSHIESCTHTHTPLPAVHVSPGSGAPLFIVNGFLNATQCEALVAKLASERVASVAYQQNRRGVDDPTARTSTHVRVIKAETPALHRRVAELTGRSVANMESVRAMHTRTGTHTHTRTRTRGPHGTRNGIRPIHAPHARCKRWHTHIRAYTLQHARLVHLAGSLSE